jgi:hypothetical protein
MTVVARGRLAVVGLLALGAAGYLLAAVPLGAKTSALPAGNLAQNPGFEEGPGAPDRSFVASLPKWQRPGTGVGFTAVRYGAAGGFPGLTVRDAIAGQTNFAAGGPASAGQKYTDLQQSIDVSAGAAQIDRGDVQVKSSALIGGRQGNTDYGRVTIELYGAKGADGFTPFFGSVELGPVLAADRDDQTKLVRRSKATDLPKGTRRLQVILRAFGGSGGYADAYFDNISVELAQGTNPSTTSTTSTRQTTTAPTSSTTTSPTTTGTGSKPPARKPALSLACSRHRLVATIKPAKGSVVLYVSFLVNGKTKATDRKAPFVARISTKGLRLPLRVAAVVHLKRSTVTLRKQFHRC